MLKFWKNLIKNIVSTKVKTKLVYLIDWFTKFRNEFIKSLKLTTFQNPTLNIMSLFSHNKIIKVNGFVEGHETDIFSDTCSSVNLITKSALEIFKITKPSIGVINETFLQAFFNNSKPKIFELTMKIESLEFLDYFKLVEKNVIFDILIGVDSLKRNKFILYLVDNSLSYINNNNQLVKLSNLSYDINVFGNQPDLSTGDKCETCINGDNNFNNENNNISQSNDISPILLTITRAEPNSNKKSNGLSLESIPSKERIIRDVVKNLPYYYQNEAITLFYEYLDILANKTDDLGETEFLPQYINLMPGAHPIKKRAYRIPKVITNTLKIELNKLINSKLIEPSHSPWSSPVFLVPKKNGQVRLYVDYRKVNDLTVKILHCI